MSLRTECSEVAGKPVVTLTGSVDLSSVPALQDALNLAVLEHAGKTIAVDVDAVDVLDDTGLGVLLGAAARARRGGGDIVVVCTDAAIRRQLHLSGFDRAVTVAESLSRLTAPGR